MMAGQTESIWKNSRRNEEYHVQERFRRMVKAY